MVSQEQSLAWGRASAPSSLQPGGLTLDSRVLDPKFWEHSSLSLFAIAEQTKKPNRPVHTKPLWAGTTQREEKNFHSIFMPQGGILDIIKVHSASSQSFGSHFNYNSPLGLSPYQIFKIVAKQIHNEDIIVISIRIKKTKN